MICDRPLLNDLHTFCFIFQVSLQPGYWGDKGTQTLTVVTVPKSSNGDIDPLLFSCWCPLSAKPVVLQPGESPALDIPTGVTDKG